MKNIIVALLVVFTCTNMPVMATKYGAVNATIIAPRESNGAIPVNIQDQTSEIIDLYLMTPKDTLFLASTVALHADSVILPGAAVVAGDYLCFMGETRYSQIKVLSRTVDTVRLATQIDFPYTPADTIYVGEHDAAVNGSVTRQEYCIKPPRGVKWDITRITIHIEDGTVMDDGKFGGITALTKGVVFRLCDGYCKNLFTIASNGEFAERFDFREYVEKPPSGTGYAMNARRNFAGQQNNGVTIRLNGATADLFKVIIQDNLTGLDHFHINIQGHVVED
jgi:hypothetical protein